MKSQKQSITGRETLNSSKLGRIRFTISKKSKPQEQTKLILEDGSSDEKTGQ